MSQQETFIFARNTLRLIHQSRPTVSTVSDPKFYIDHSFLFDTIKIGKYIDHLSYRINYFVPEKDV